MLKRNALQRLRKYESKLDPEIIKRRFEAEREAMIEQMANIFSDICELEEKAKAIIDEEGPSVIAYPFYLTYARELWRLTRKYGGRELTREIQILEQKWQARDLNPSLMERLRTTLFGITLPSE